MQTHSIASSISNLQIFESTEHRKCVPLDNELFLPKGRIAEAEIRRYSSEHMGNGQTCHHCMVKQSADKENDQATCALESV